MSTPEGNEFGIKHGEAYLDVISKWTKRLHSINKITDEIKKEWSSDLRSALEEDLVKNLEKEAITRWSKLDLPPKETINRFAVVAARRALGPDSFDLLKRLHIMAKEAKPSEVTFTSGNANVTYTLVTNSPVTINSNSNVTFELTPEGNLNRTAARATLTVSQVFDMAGDWFDKILGKFFRRRDQMTGRRRWKVGFGTKGSRHSRLEGQVKEEGESFVYKGEAIYGPRPPGGAPGNWSNCSCYLEYEKADGSWVTRR